MSDFLIGLIVVEAAILLWVILNSLFIIRLKEKKDVSSGQRVSVLIPLRDEEDNVRGLISSLRAVDYPNIEFLLLDDGSSDQTFSLLQEETESDGRFSIYSGNELPEGWNGKVYACHQLSQKAKGDLLLFVDADVRLESDAVTRTLMTMQHKKASMLSGFPRYPSTGFLSQLLVSLQHFVVFTHLPLFVANYSTRPSFTAASGAFIAITRTTYQSVGGHKALKESILEDVHLARLVKKHGRRMILVNITSSMSCYMYSSFKDTWDGFTKNIFEGIGRSKIGAVLLTLFYGIIYVSPLFWFGLGILKVDGLYLLPYLFTVLQKLFIDLRTRTSWKYALAMPISSLLFIGVLWRSMVKSIRGKAYTWKGRSYQ